jgi:hypothetical protein
MIERQENVIPILVLEEENTIEDIELHAQIDGGDILNFLYNLLPHPSSQVEKMGGVFFVNFFLAIPLLILLLKPHFCPTFLFHVRRWVGHFYGEIVNAIPQTFVGDFLSRINF